MAPASSLGPAALIRTALDPTKLARVAEASYRPSTCPLPELPSRSDCPWCLVLWVMDEPNVIGPSRA